MKNLYKRIDELEKALVKEKGVKLVIVSKETNEILKSFEPKKESNIIVTIRL